MSAFAFRVSADIANARRTLGRLQKDVEEKLVVQALNKTGATVRSRTVKQLSGQTGMQQKVIRDKVALIKARRGANKRMYAVVQASRYTVNLIELVKPGQRKANYFNKRIGKGKNVHYRSPGVVAKAWGKSKVYKGTFIGTDGKGELKVFARTSKARGKLKQISGPSLRNAFKTAEMHKFMRDIAAERFPVELERAFGLRVAKNK